MRKCKTTKNHIKLTSTAALVSPGFKKCHQHTRDVSKERRVVALVGKLLVKGDHEPLPLLPPVNVADS